MKKTRHSAKKVGKKSLGLPSLKRSYIWMGIGLLAVIITSLLILSMNTGDRQANFTGDRKVKTGKHSTVTTPSNPSTKIYTPPSPNPASGTAAPAGIWIPDQNTSWQWQLKSPVDQSVNVSVYDIDGSENSSDVVNSLHAAGRHVICYIDVGAAEDYRPDYDKFPASVKGNLESQWPGHYMLDIRRLDILGPIMLARLDMCKAKGFDAVEPDEDDIYQNDSGFPLTKDDQLAYDRYIADAAHARGLSVGLKNGIDMVNDLLPSFDWTLNEQCFENHECDKIMPFISAGKAVFNTEYNIPPASFCGDANQRNFNSLYKKVELDAYRVACR